MYGNIFLSDLSGDQFGAQFELQIYTSTYIVYVL